MLRARISLEVAVIVDEASRHSIEREPIGVRTVHLSAYVERPLAEVWALFADPAIDELLEESMRVALASPGNDGIRAHVSRPVRDSRDKGHVAVQWHGPGVSAPSNEGVAEISLLVVQSGRDPLTELHVALPVGTAHPAALARNARRFLDEVTDRLEHASP